MMEKMRNKKKKGFTLIELIVVIVILAILALVAIPRLTQQTARAERSACQATQRTISSAASIHEANTGAQPANIPALVTAGLLAEAPVCPHNPAGTYTLNADGTVTCSITAHN